MQEAAMIFLKTGSWVLVADGEKALFLRNHQDTREYDLRVVWHTHSESPASHAQGSDRPGRTSVPSSPRRAALQEADWHQLGEDRFAAKVAAILNHAAQDNAFEEIVLIAPPRVLGELRTELTSQAMKKVVAEIPKTLTNHPIEKIESLLKVELETG
jgi:protein required for attachment to host cells